jgi:WD40 repeat protein
VWDRAGGQSLATFEHSDAVDSVAFADGHAKLVTGTRDGYSYVWDANVGETRYDLLSPVHALAIAPDGTVAVGTDNSDVTLIRGGTTTKLDDGHIGRVFAVAFTPDGKKLVSAGEDRRPIVWDVATGQKLRELREHKAAVRALAISDDGRWVATAAGDEVNVWTLDGKLVHTLFFDRSATLTTVAFSPQAAYVEAGADDGTLLSWDIQTGQGISWRKLPTAITAIAHSPRDGALVVAAASQVEIFPRVVKDHIQRYGASVSLDSPGEVRSVAFSDDGSLVITAGGDGAKIWDVRTGKLVATRDAHGHALGALALRGSTLWLARSNNDNDNDKDNDNTVASWPVRIETHDAESLDAFVRDRDPWLLGEDDVIQLKGTLDGQRGSDSQ